MPLQVEVLDISLLDESGDGSITVIEVADNTEFSTATVLKTEFNGYDDYFKQPEKWSKCVNIADSGDQVF